MSDKKSLFISFFTTIISFVLINGISGIYYTGYERLFNGFFMHEFSSRLTFDENFNVWFLTAPLISWLNHQCIYSNSILFTAIIITNTSLLVYNVSKLLSVRSTPVLICLNIFVIIFFSAILIHLSNRQTVIWIVFNIAVHLYRYSKGHKSALDRITIVVLFCMAMVVRFEIAFILFLFSCITSILFNEKLLLKYLSVCLFFSILTLSFFHILQNTVYKQYKYIEKAEHEIYDRNAVDVSASMDKKDLLKLKAYTYFIVDKEHLNADYYQHLFNKKQLIANKLTPKYFKHVSLKLKSFYSELFFDKSFLLYFILSVLLLLFSGKYWRKQLLIILLILGMPAFFNIFLDFKTDLTLTMYSFFVFSCLVWYFKNQEMQKVQRNIIIFYVLIILAYSTLNIFYAKKYYDRHDKHLITYYRNILKFGKESNRAVVFSNLVGNFECYPSKLFSISKKDLLPHYYLNLFFYSNYSYYKNHNNKFFTNIESFEGRIRDIVDKKVLFLSNEEQNEFIVEYMHEVCNYDIIIQKEEKLNRQFGSGSGLNPYFTIYSIENTSR